MSLTEPGPRPPRGQSTSAPTDTHEHESSPGRRRPRSRLLAHGVVKALRADCRAAGVPVRTANGQIHFHSLRHTTATLLSRAGVPVRTAQELVRHRGPRTTVKVYAHCYPADKLAAIGRLPKLDTDDGGGRACAEAGDR